MRLFPERFPLLPRRKNTDKFSYGHVLVLAGSRAMPGAALLCSEAALRSGAGLVSLGAPKSASSLVMRKSSPEIMHLALPETARGTLAPAALAAIETWMRGRRVNALALGPGLSHDTRTSRLVRSLTVSASVPIVLDADGLNGFKGRAKDLSKHRAPLVLTPHRGEFERLFSQKWPETVSARGALAKKLSRFYDVVLVLKSHKTVVASRDKLFVNSTGNPGMAKGGSGDVLTGILAAFLAQGLDSFAAAAWAVYFHGKAGDLAVRTKGPLSLTPSDLIGALSRAFGARV